MYGALYRYHQQQQQALFWPYPDACVKSATLRKTHQRDSHLKSNLWGLCRVEHMGP